METLTEKAEQIAGILAEENIFDKNEKYAAFERRGFVTSVVEGGAGFNYLELTYHQSNTRIIIRYIDPKNPTALRSVDAFPYYGTRTEGVDYDRLNQRIASVIAG